MGSQNGSQNGHQLQWAQGILTGGIVSDSHPSLGGLVDSIQNEHQGPHVKCLPQHLPLGLILGLRDQVVEQRGDGQGQGPLGRFTQTGNTDIVVPNCKGGSSHQTS